MYPEIRMVDQNKIDAWLRTSGYSKKTITGYRWLLRRVGRYMAARQIQIEDFTPEDLLDFMDGEGWGENMRTMCQIAVRAYCRYYTGTSHPIFALPVKRKKPTPQRTLSEEEVIRLLQSIDLSGQHGMVRHVTAIRNYALITLMLDTGIRAAEVCRLALKHMDLENRSFRVLTKGGSFKTKIYSQEAGDFLEDWLMLRGQYAVQGVDNVFVGILGNTPGQPFTTSGLRALFRKLGKKAGIEGLSPHVLRRTFATLATIYGAPAVVLQKAGGWENIQTMTVYTQAVPNRAIETYLPVNRILGNSKNRESEALLNGKKPEPKQGGNVHFLD